MTQFEDVTLKDGVDDKENGEEVVDANLEDMEKWGELRQGRLKMDGSLRKTKVRQEL
jgi:hypothetical protein